MSGLAPLTDVSGNSWLVCSLLFLVRFGIVGACCSWALGAGTWRAHPIQRWVLTGAAALLCGLLVNTLGAILLAELGIYTRRLEWLLLIAVAGCGRYFAALRAVDWTDHVKDCLPAVIATPVVAALIMLAPARGAWIAGGWDPGIYVTQGICVSEAETFHPENELGWTFLGEEGFCSLSRAPRQTPSAPYHEYLPGVPIDPGTGEIQHFFFRGMPAYVAVIERCGGLRAATRSNLFAGWIALVAFAAMSIQLLATSAARWMSFAILSLHPVFWFMAHFPTSEMLQLAVVTGAVAWIPAMNTSRSAGRFIAVLLFFGMLNRFSFLPFAALLLCTISWIGLQFDRPAQRLERLGQACALAGGAIVCFACCPITIDRLGHHVAPLLYWGLPLLALSLLLTLTPFRRHLSRFATKPNLPGFLLLPIALAFPAREALLQPGEVVTVAQVAFPVLPYMGAVLLTAALLGLIVVLSGRSMEQKTGITVLWFFAAAVVGTVVTSNITLWLPFAIRRHLVYSLPCVALLAGALFATCWRKTEGRRILRTAVLLSGIALPLSNLERTCHALTHTEYTGLPKIIERIAENIGPSDVVVVDHFKWGTPLRFLFGAAVLNGETLWEKTSNPEKRMQAMRGLREARGRGHRVLFLTSTENGLACYKHKIAAAGPLWDSGEIEITALKHMKHAKGFTPLTRTKRFRIYELKDSPPN